MTDAQQMKYLKRHKIPIWEIRQDLDRPHPWEVEEVRDLFFHWGFELMRLAVIQPDLFSAATFRLAMTAAKKFQMTQFSQRWDARQAALENGAGI